MLLYIYRTRLFCYYSSFVGSDDPITQSPENRPCRKQRSPPTPASSKSPSTNSPRPPASSVAAPPVKSPCACASTSRSPARLLLLAGAVPPPRDQRRIPSSRPAPRSLLPTGAAPPPTVRRRAPSQQLRASNPSCVNPTSQSARALRLRCPQHPRVGDPELRDQPSPPSKCPSSATTHTSVRGSLLPRATRRYRITCKRYPHGMVVVEYISASSESRNRTRRPSWTNWTAWRCTSRSFGVRSTI